ncbi:MAG: hypothetical protein MSC31_13905 [Solirubrobacteraceae bacterium MAG38_C4-C5]|nr:hypothetical protein [Candidatus Siliceabacter maunaloa]
MTGPSASGPIVGLVDSGADRTCLPMGYATLIGYAADQLELHQGQGVGGSLSLWQAMTPATAVVAGLPHPEIELRPTFIEGGSTPLWGRADFFATFGVCFDERAQQFTISLP